MTNLNLRKQKIKDRFIIHFVIFGFLLLLLPIAIYSFVDWLHTATDYSSKKGGILFIWIICFVMYLISFVRLLLIHMQFRKITFPTEEMHTTYCKKITYGRLGMRFIKMKTDKGNFIYIPPREVELSLEQLRGNYQNQTLILKCYAETKFVKEMQLQG